MKYGPPSQIPPPAPDLHRTQALATAPPQTDRRPSRPPPIPPRPLHRRFRLSLVPLIIEIDGPSHDVKLKQDETRTAWLQSQGFRLLRFTNEQVLRDFDSVIETIQAELNSAVAQENIPL